MGTRRWLAWSVVCFLFCASTGLAQMVDEREAGSEIGIDVIYQLSTDVDFNGGSRLDLDDDIGLTLTYGYRFNPNVALQFAIDWNKIDYDGTLQSASLPGLSADVSGDLETITPRVTGLYYFLDGPITPFVMAGIGWSFIDTNIPTGQVTVGCWWDPWWGNICTPYQPTKDVDGFAYQAGLGGRWDFADMYTLTATYNKAWVDLDQSDGTPDVDQFRVGFFARF